MKIDLVGPRNRGLATGLNEFAGYLSVAGAAWATGIVAEQYGLRPGPFYLGHCCSGDRPHALGAPGEGNTAARQLRSS